MTNATEVKLEFRPSQIALEWTDVLLNGSLIGWISAHKGKRRFDARPNISVSDEVRERISAELEKKP